MRKRMSKRASKREFKKNVHKLDKLNTKLVRGGPHL